MSKDNSEFYPKITTKRVVHESPWMKFEEKEVLFTQNATAQKYHCVQQNDYVGVLARTEDGYFPLVRQYRPAVETFTLEFPAGTVDVGETPRQAACRELVEETGLEPLVVVELFTGLRPDTGRLNLYSHGFFIQTPPFDQMKQNTESQVEVQCVRKDELEQMMMDGRFVHQLHWALYGAALWKGIKL